MASNNIAETLRNYANIEELGPVFRNVLLDAADYIDSLTRMMEGGGEDKVR